MRGILFDQPQIVAAAPELLARAGVADRCEVVGGVVPTASQLSIIEGFPA